VAANDAFALFYLARWPKTGGRSALAAAPWALKKSRRRRTEEKFNARRVYRPDSVRQVSLAGNHSSARIIAEPL